MLFRRSCCDRWGLRKGLEHGVQLLMAKALVSSIYSGYGVDDIYRASIDWAMERSVSWGGGPTFLVAVRNIQGYLDRDSLATALLRGMAILSGEASDRPPRPLLDPMGSPQIERLKLWLRRLAEVRDTAGVEVILYTMASQGYSLREVAEAFFTAARTATSGTATQSTLPTRRSSIWRPSRAGLTPM